jgi:aminoglycoside 6'-N-acetyltransferase
MDADNSLPSTELGFRPLAREDPSLLGRWLAEPYVRRWWKHDPHPVAVEADFGPAIDGSLPTHYFLVLEGGRPIGLIQSYRIGDHPEWMEAVRVANATPDSVGIDYLIGKMGSIGRGLGAEMIRRFVDQVLASRPLRPRDSRGGTAGQSPLLACSREGRVSPHLVG